MTSSVVYVGARGHRCPLRGTRAGGPALCRGVTGMQAPGLGPVSQVTPGPGDPGRGLFWLLPRTNGALCSARDPLSGALTPAGGAPGCLQPGSGAQGGGPGGARAAQVWGSECMNSAGMRADPGYGKSRGITRFFVTFLCDNGALKTLKVKTQFAWKGRQGQRPHTAGLIGTLRRTKTHVWTCPGGCVTVTDLPGVTPATCWVSANLRSGHHPAVCLPLKVPRVSWNTPGVSCRNRPRVPARGRPCPELPWGITSLHVPVFLWL